MRAALALAAVLLAVGRPAPALLVLGLAGAVHAARSPDRLLDAGYAAAFCGLGYLAG